MTTFTQPQFSKKTINKAGNAIRAGVPNVTVAGVQVPALAVVENHRASHYHVLNTFQANLRTRSRDLPVTFAQRLKRRPTIFDKLRREDGMQLARMHDVAGCRLIFEDVVSLNEFQRNFRRARFKHKRRYGGEERDPYDYIHTPKSSGYRGRHDVYQYVAHSPAGEAWNGLHIEIQYRTKVQHAWATAVEIAGSISENRPKFDQGDNRFLRFFQLTSEILARFHEDRMGPLPEIETRHVLEEFADLESQIHLLRSLRNINQANVDFVYARNVILMFNEDDDTLEVESFQDSAKAVTRYAQLEKSALKELDVVLVRSDSTESIRNAFRNYFSDSVDFVALIDGAIA